MGLKYGQQKLVHWEFSEQGAHKPGDSAQQGSNYTVGKFLSAQPPPWIQWEVGYEKDIATVKRVKPYTATLLNQNPSTYPTKLSRTRTFACYLVPT